MNGRAAILAAQTDNFKALGLWQAQFVFANNYKSWSGNQYQHFIVYLASAWAYLQLGEATDSPLGQWLDHLNNLLSGMATSDFFWGACAYRSKYGRQSVQDYYASWDEVPHVMPETTQTFDGPTGWIQTIGWTATGSTSISMANDGSGTAWEVGDAVVFARDGLNLSGNDPPSELTPDATYYIAETDVPNHRARVAPNPDGSGKWTSFPSLNGGTKANVTVAIRRQHPPTAPFTVGVGGKCFVNPVGESDAESYAAYYLACTRFAIHAGRATPSDAWVQNVEARVQAARTVRNWYGNFVGDYNKQPQWWIRPTV
jgi:hypothetical protein